MRCIQEEIVILEIIIIVYSFELANKQKGKKIHLDMFKCENLSGPFSVRIIAANRK